MSKKPELHSDHENSRRLIDSLDNYVFVAFGIAFIMFISFIFLSNKCYLKYHIDKYSIFAPGTDIDKIKENNDLTFNQNMKEEIAGIYNNRKDHYDKNITSLSSVINGMGICCLLGICLLYFDKRDEIEFFGVSIPFKSIFLLLPVVMLYLWLSFGFSLSTAIDSRAVCYVSAVKLQYFSEKVIELEGNHPSKDSTGTNPTSSEVISSGSIDTTLAISVKFNRDYSKIHALDDNGILDGMANVYMGLYTDTVYTYFYNFLEGPPPMAKKDEELNMRTLIKTTKDKQIVAVAISLFTVFGTLCGLTIGLLIALLLRFQRVYSNNSNLTVALTISVVTFLGVTFIGFLMEKSYLISFCAYIWLVAGIVLWLYSIKLEKYAQAGEPLIKLSA
ncbi:MAG TPA: hypothetical protein VK177_13500 [Flavobacteriales bacterium]|nr:hypothetical protein [Flavobacteriales bacterium]